MNKVLIALFVVGIGVAAGWYYISSDRLTKSVMNVPAISVSPSPLVTASIEQPVASDTVTYTDAGFSPKTITVKKGTAVSFTNASAIDMWVVSGVHPTHQLLPGFDQKGAKTKGGVFTYTFTKIGTWQYHNEGRPTDTAFVVVTD